MWNGQSLTRPDPAEERWGVPCAVFSVEFQSGHVHRRSLINRLPITRVLPVKSFRSRRPEQHVHARRVYVPARNYDCYVRFATTVVRWSAVLFGIIDYSSGTASVCGLDDTRPTAEK